jgi:hypothetical protein
MTDTLFNPLCVYALPVEDADLALFDPANDLPLSNTAQAFDDSRIAATIEHQARVAQLQSDAESALMLATLFKDDAHRHLAHLENAEAAAFALGEASYQRGTGAQNPFLDVALATAWNNGYVSSARQDVVVPDNGLEARLWNDGIDTETGQSQYTLTAIALLRLAETTRQPRLKARAQRLAQEVLVYQQGEVPTPRRQLEIDRFLGLQTRRLASAIDFNGL